jgi:hypothetical protein
MEKNCVLLVGTLMCQPEFLFKKKDVWKKLLIDLKKKIIDPNNCDIFMCLDYDLSYPIYKLGCHNKKRTLGIILDKNTEKEVEKNIKNIFGESLKTFNIITRDGLKEKEAKFVKKNLDLLPINRKNERGPIFLNFNGSLHQFFKAFTCYEKSEQYTIKNKIKYDNYFIVRPDYSVHRKFLFSELDKSRSHCGFNAWLFMNNYTIKNLCKNFTKFFKETIEGKASMGSIPIRESTYAMTIDKADNHTTSPKWHHWKNFGSTNDCRRCHPDLIKNYSKEDLVFFHK